MSNATKKNLDLSGFTGSEEYTRFRRNMLLTEGVTYLAKEAECFWLLDIISSYQAITEVRNEEFQVYILRVDLEKSTATVECNDGNDNILKTQFIEFTDFPLKEIKLYYTDGVVLLPSEY